MALAIIVRNALVRIKPLHMSFGGS